MKPFYAADGITLFCGKAEEIVTQLAARHFGVLVLDPPFTFAPDKAFEVLAPFDGVLRQAAAVLILGLDKENGVPATRAFGHYAARSLAGMLAVLQKTEGPILDPYCGVGATLVAAKRLGREAVGIELEQKFCEVARLRLENQLR
jgi:DNA modification methylase